LNFEPLTFQGEDKMRTKYITLILTIFLIFIVLSTSYAADEFYYGVWGGEHWPSVLKDSLKSNIATSWAYLDLLTGLANNGLRALVWSGDNNTDGPGYWASNSHYTLWEPERFPESNYHLYYDGGTLVSDTSASGGKAMKFTNLSTRLLQWGPSYEQERGPESYPINYTAGFNLKFISALYDPPNQKSGNPPVPVCSLMVVDTISHSILKHKTLFRSDFPRRDYKLFYLEGYTVPSGNRIDFQIYIFGTTAAYYFYVDYVKVYDEYGKQLIDQKLHDQDIMAYVDSNWVRETKLPSGEPVVYRWQLKDEPNYIDYFQPFAHIDSLLKTVSEERVGFQANTKFAYPDFIHDYMLRENPKDYSIDPYPTWKFGNNYSGEAYQEAWSTYTGWLERSKTVADNLNKDLWVTLQAHFWGDEVNDPDSCPDGPAYPYEGKWYCGFQLRPPTGNELRLQTFLALCYGADGILNFYYMQWIDKSNPNQWKLRLGLYDTLAHAPTERWNELAHFTGPRVEKLGPIFNQLTWQGACSNQEVGSFVLRNSQTSYIDSVVGRQHDSTYVQVGFFDHSDTSYFMLINRKCLDEEDETLKVYFDIPNGPYLLRDMYTNQPSYTFYANCPSIISLKPGEGRLFRIEQYPFSTYVKKVPQTYSVIQNAINAAQNNDTVLVAPGTYNERINLRGKPIPVASYYILLGEQQYKNYTCIDAHVIPSPDSASVITFSSGEDSNSVIEGFTLKNGKGTIPPFKSEDRYGGGIYCEGSSPTIRNNIIQGNQAYDGQNSSGGGIYCTGCNPGPTIISNLIQDNKSIYGGGICCDHSSPKIINNLITGNDATYNTKDTSIEDGNGGGIECDNRSRPIIVNNTLDGNYAYLYGGGIDITGHSHVEIYNNIVSSTDQGDGIYVYSSTDTALISYNDFWNNSEENIDGIVNSALGDTTWGNNRNGTPCDSFYNIFRNPEFTNSYHLDSSSACVNAGDNNAPDLPEFDYHGNPRVVDFVDIGACEYQGGGSGNKNAKIAGNSDSNNPPLPKAVRKEFALSQSYPNPFNPVAVIEFNISNEHPSSHINLRIYNITGQLVKTLMDEEKTPGTYTVTWDGRNNSNEEVASGVYFYELKSNNLMESKRMVLIK
jgi:hypothetical protein